MAFTNKCAPRSYKYLYGSRTHSELTNVFVIKQQIQSPPMSKQQIRSPPMSKPLQCEAWKLSAPVNPQSGAQQERLHPNQSLNDWVSPRRGEALTLKTRDQKNLQWHCAQLWPTFYLLDSPSPSWRLPKPETQHAYP